MSRGMPRDFTWPNGWPAKGRKFPASPTDCPPAAVWNSPTRSRSTGPWRGGANCPPETKKPILIIMSVPSVVVFDLGKVLVDFDYGIAAKKIAQRSRFNPAQVRDLLDHSPLLYRFDADLRTKEEFYGEVCAACGFSGTLDEFCAAFADIFSEIKSMIQMQAALRAAGIPTFIFSNTNDIAIGHIRERFPFFSGFDGYVLSYEHGA